MGISTMFTNWKYFLKKGIVYYGVQIERNNLNRTIFMTKIKVIIDGWLYFWTIFQRMFNNCVLVIIKLLT